MTIADLQHLDRMQFASLLGDVFEHSEWVAERAWRHRPFGSLTSLYDAMVNAVEEASSMEQLGLIRAHPDLGTRARISASSAGEQAGAGLDSLTQPEFDELVRLNELYRTRFGFPFIYAVRGSDKSMILAALQQRIGANVAEEHRVALKQIYRIAAFRLQAIFPEDNL